VNNDGEITGQAPPILLEVVVMDVDPLRAVFKINTQVSLAPGVDPNSVGNATLLLGNYKPVRYDPRQSMYLDQDVTVLATGDAAKYPFDKFRASIPFAVTRTSVLADASAPSLNWGAVAFGALQNLRFEAVYHTDPKSSIVHVELAVKRSPTTKGFAMFIVIIMWCLTLGAVLITFQIVFRQREAMPPVISIMIALLFALPAVRNTQPAAPPIGTLLDTVSLIWNMMLVSLCAITLMVTWLWQSPSPTPPPVVDDKLLPPGTPGVDGFPSMDTRREMGSVSTRGYPYASR